MIRSPDSGRPFPRSGERTTGRQHGRQVLAARIPRRCVSTWDGVSASCGYRDKNLGGKQGQAQATGRWSGQLTNVCKTLFRPICHNLPMCGRYRLSRRKQLIEEYFASVSRGEDDWSPRYNIAPTQSVPVIRQNPKEPVRELSLLRWGLIPSWAKDSSGSAKMINARSETAGTKPAFRDALKFRRCLIPADAFYEWTRTGKTRQPYCFEVNDGKLFAFAGLWDRWRDPDGKTLETCSILTTTANAVTSATHDRMPVILHPDGHDLWLDPGMRDGDAASDLLKPCDARLMRCYPVSTRINHVANDDEGCAAPVELAQIQARLFL
jgi:putative SOS response-associated peptidase YedK